MAGFSDLLQVLVSCTVDLMGNGAVHGGKGIMMAGARRIGWASGGSSRQGRKFSGHSLARRSLGGGFGGVGRGSLHNYDPKRAYQQQTTAQYRAAMRSGSGAGGAGKGKSNMPAHLFGRPTFQAADGPLGHYGSRWCKGSAYRPGGYTKRPRGNINF